MPVIVKLTPNITDIRRPARAAKAGRRRRGVADQHHQLDHQRRSRRFSPEPSIDGKGTHGGYCGPAVKPIALSMVSEIARDKETAGLPISGIGGITDWRDAAEFMALGAGNVQVCTAAMTYGFKIVEEMISASRYLDAKGQMKVDDFVGRAIPNVTDWQYLNLNYVDQGAGSTRTSASSAAAATSSARTPRTRRSPR
jgi:dihydropyrimidine dehydrogenase (NAD+) subunit PreA